MFLIGLFIVSTFNSCKQQKEFSLGNYDKGIYTNPYFGISFELPDNWYFIDSNGRVEIVKKNINRLTENDTVVANNMKKSMNKVHSIFVLFKYPPDTIIEVNPNITMTATNIKSYPKLSNIEYAIKSGKQGMIEANKLFEIEDGTVENKIGNKLFRGFEASIEINSMIANYRMLRL